MATRQSGLERFRADTSVWRSAILIAAAELDLFAWIGKSARSPSAVAAHFGGDPQAWEIFLNALCALGRLGKRGKKYSNRLRRDAAPVRPRQDDSWSGLAAALQSGARPKTQTPFFSDAKAAYRLLSALDADARAIAPHLIARLRVQRAGTLLDVGGGLGTFSVAFCRRYPRLRATVLEHPRIAPLARRAVGKAGLGKRIR